MKRIIRLCLPLLVVGGLGVSATLSSGCVVRAGAGVGVAAPAPRLVAVSPGVYVVEDYGDSVFFVNGAYWRYDGRFWYRSGYYDGGFVRVGYAGVPVRVRGIRRPRSYVRYRARPGARYHSVRARRRARARRANRRARRANRRAIRSNRRARRSNRRAIRSNRRANRANRRATRRNNRARTRDRRRNKRDKRVRDNR